MRLGYRPTRFLGLAAIFAAGIVVGQAMPVIWKSVVIATAQSSYQEATYRCDRSMRDHLLAKQALYAAPSEDAVEALEAAEIGLIDCQDYDLLRKRLLLLGLDETALSLMALKAIEAKAGDLQEVIDIHEIRY
jgi:hypothetical protein